MTSNQQAEDLRRCCDMYAAENARLRDALRWAATVLNDAVRGRYRADERDLYKIGGETRTVEQILDAADVALQETSHG